MDAVLARPSRPGRPLARFSTVSIISTALTLLVIALLTEIVSVDNREAAAVATAIGFAVSYPLTRSWVFGGGARTDHAIAIVWLGGLSLAGVLLSGVAGAGVDAVAAQAGTGSTLTLAWEEITESIVLGALFLVRFVLARILFTAPPAR